MRHFIPLIFVFVLFPSVLFAQSEKSDSLILLVNQMPDSEEKLKVLLDLSDGLNWQNIELARTYIRQAIPLAKKLDNKIQLGEAYEEYSENLWNTFPDSASLYLAKARATWKEVDYRLGEAHILGVMAGEAETAGDFDLSMEYSLQSLSIYVAENDQVEVNNGYVSIGGLLLSMGRYEDALSYIQKAEKYMLSEEGKLDRPYYYLILGELYWSQDDCISAIDIYLKLQSLAKELGFYNDYISASVKLGDCYLRSGKVKLGEENYLLAIDQAEEFGSVYFMGLSRLGISELYISQGRYEEAIVELEKAKEAHNNPIYKYVTNRIYKQASQAYQAIGNYEKAFENLETYTSNQESFFTERSEKIAQELEAKYETEKQQAVIERNKREQAYMLGALGLFALATLMLVRAYSAKKKTNKILAKTNEQKEFLIKEIHHRVKNNLQVLSSLLNLQSDYIQDPNALTAVTEGRNRVESMGLIHQKLYMGEHLASVNMNEYTTELTGHLLSTFGLEENVQIATNIRIPRMDVDTAIPLGLIINELITNSLKYAFPNGKNGKIIIDLFIDDKKDLILLVKDDGVGKVDISNKSKSTSFGSDLVKILSKKLKGRIETSSDDGYSTMISFGRYKLGE